MEPFIADKDEHYSNHRESARSRNPARPYVLLMVFTALVLLVVSGALVAMLFSQQKSFDALRSNFQGLQSSLDRRGDGNEPGADDSEQADTAPEAPVIADAVDIASSPEFSSLSGKVAGIESALDSLKSQISAVEKKIPTGQVAPSADIRQLSRAVTTTNSALTALRDELLTIKLSLDDLETRDTAMERRLDSMERAVISLNEFRRSSDSAEPSYDAQAIARIQRDIQLLKQQHPYLRD